MLRGVGLRNVLIGGACKESVEHVLFECASYDSQRQNFLDHMKQVLTSEAFGNFYSRQHFR